MREARVTRTLRPTSEPSTLPMLSKIDSRRMIENSISLLRMVQFSAMDVDGPM